MSAKINFGGGLFGRTLTRGPKTGKIMFVGRVWIPTEARVRYLKLGVTTEKEARKALAKVDPETAFQERDALKAGPPAPGPEPLRFDAMLDRFLAEYRSRGNSGYYGHVAVSWRAFFNNAEVASVSRPRVEAYREHLRREGYGDSSIRKYIGALGTMFRWAAESCDPPLVTVNPAAGVKRPSEPDREVEVLSLDEQKKLLATVVDDLRPVVELCIAAGLRRGEALSLLWAQIDEASGNILIRRSKTGKARSIPLTPQLTAILARVTKRDGSPLVFHNTEGRPWDERGASRALETALTRAGIRKVLDGEEGEYQGVFNLLRHTFGSRLASAGVPLAVVAALMGNSARVCERHYVRFGSSDLKAAMLAGSGPIPTVPQTVPQRVRRPQTSNRKHLQLVAK
jgi:integrase